MNRWINGLLISCALSCVGGVAPAQKVAAPLDVKDVLEMRSFASRQPVDLSPDGEWVAYTLKSQLGRKLIEDERYQVYSPTGVPIEGLGASVLVTNVKSGETKKLIDEPGQSWGGAWSPDSRYLAFYSDRSGQAALWVWDRTSGQVRQVSKEITRTSFGFEVPQWTPDSQRVLVKLLPEDLTIEDAADLLVALPKRSSAANQGASDKVVVYSSTAKTEGNSQAQAQASALRMATVLNSYLSDLALIDISNGQVQRLVRRQSIASYFLSPDGSQVAFTNLKSLETQRAQQWLYDLFIVSTADAQIRLLAANVRLNYGTSISWSPDGRWIGYFTSGQLAKGDFYVIEAKGGGPRHLTTGTHPNFGANSYRQPLWNRAGDKVYGIAESNLWEIPITGGHARQVSRELDREVIGIVAPRGEGRIWSPDEGRSACVMTRDNGTKQVGFYKVDLETAQSTQLVEERKYYGNPVFHLDTCDVSRTLVYIAQDGQHYEDLWLADFTFTQRRQLTHNNPQLDKYLIGETQLVEWNSEDGEKLQGALLLPVGYQSGQRCPVIVDVYGSFSGSNFVNQFGATSTGGAHGVANNQLLATRGYAVFIPDLPLRIGTPMRDLAKCVLPGINKLVELGIADPERLGVKGVSYGGYCTLALITQTTRSKAALIRSSAGASLFTMYGVMNASGVGTWTGWAENGQGRMGGTPWELRDRYIENSPLFYLDRVTTPLMITAGTADTATPAFLSDEIFVGLQRLGKEALYVKYQGGEHGEATLDSATALDYFTRTMAWFDRWLKAPGVTPTPPERSSGPAAAPPSAQPHLIRSSRPTTAAARCITSNETPVFSGSSSRSSCERLVFIRRAIAVLVRFCRFISCSICQASTFFSAAAVQASSSPSSFRNSSKDDPACGFLAISAKQRKSGVKPEQRKSGVRKSGVKPANLRFISAMV